MLLLLTSQLIEDECVFITFGKLGCY